MSTPAVNLNPEPVGRPDSTVQFLLWVLYCAVPVHSPCVLVLTHLNTVGADFLLKGEIRPRLIVKESAALLRKKRNALWIYNSEPVGRPDSTVQFLL